jgi:putative transposase
VRYRFIKDNLSQFHVTTMCRVLEVSRSGFYGCLKAAKSERVVANDYLLGKIAEVHNRSHRTYGGRRVHRELKGQGETCSRNRVARLMSEHDLKAKTTRKFRATTNSRHSLPVAPNLLNRNFIVDAPNKAWVSDITYIPTEEGWLYLASVVDLYSRMVVGWSTGECMTKELAMDALKMAIRQRKPSAGLIHHSDRGVQYASDDYQNLLRHHGIICSMSRKGNCWDNAVIESFFGTMKTECIHHRHYHSRAEATRDIFQYTEIFYNCQRLHSTLGYKSPVQFELAKSA